MATTGCASYQAHAWKKDICVNCMKPQKYHSDVQSSQPVPARRTVVKVQRMDDSGRVNVSGKTYPKASNRKNLAKHASNDELSISNDGLENGNGLEGSKSVEGLYDNSALISPVTLDKDDGLYDNAPLSPKSDNFDDGLYDNAPLSPMCQAISKSTDTGLYENTEFSDDKAEKVKQSPTHNRMTTSLCELNANVDTGSSDKCSESGTLRKKRGKAVRPQAPPPTRPPEQSTPDKTPTSEPVRPSSEDYDTPQKRPTSEVGKHDQSSDSISLDLGLGLDDMLPDMLQHLKLIKEEDKEGDEGAHYYHKYDDTSKKKSGNTKTPVSTTERRRQQRNELIDKIQSTLERDKSPKQQRAMEITTDQIALPYNIVDVMSKPPRESRPPKLPNTPAPETSTLERKKAAKSSVSPGRKTEKVEPKVTSKVEPTKTAENISPNKGPILKGLPPSQSHAYEMIDMPRGKDAKKDTNNIPNSLEAEKPFVRQSPGRATVPVKATLPFNQVTTKDSLLAHLDLSKSLSDEGPSSASPVSNRAISEPPQEHFIIPKVKRDDSKTRKSNSNNTSSGGFFSRLFGRRKKDSNENSAEDKSEDKTTESVTPPSPSENSTPSDTPETSSATTSPNLSTDPDLRKSMLSEIQSAMQQKLPTADDANTSPTLADQVTKFADDTEEAKTPTSEPLEVKINSEIESSSLRKSPSTDKKPTPAQRSPANIAKTISPKTKDQPISTVTKKETTKVGSPTSATKPKIANAKPRPTISSPKPNVKPASTEKTPPVNKPTSPTYANKTCTKSPVTSPSKTFLHSDQLWGTWDEQPTTPVEETLKNTPESPSKSSIHSEGERSISSRDDQGSSGDSRDLFRENSGRKPRPRSTAVSRKMLDAPPPPPPPGSEASRRLSGSGTCSPQGPVSPKSLSSGPSSPLKRTISDDANTTKTASGRTLEISGPIAVVTTFNSLPRPTKRGSKVTMSLKETQDDLSSYRRKTSKDSSARNSRNKTITEGINLDLGQIKESTKFKNRALPPPPKEDLDKRVPIEADENHADLENHYELVSLGNESHNHTHSKPPMVPANRGAYEDIAEEEMYKDPLDAKRGVTVALSDLCDPSLPSQMNTPLPSTEYLEPVNTVGKTAKESSDLKKKINANAEKRRRKILAKTDSKTSPAKTFSVASAESYVLIYANTEMIMDSTRPAVNAGEGFSKMAIMNLETLQSVSESIISKYLPARGELKDDLRWVDYSRTGTRHFIVQGCVGFYKARTIRAEPNDCFLMLSARTPSLELLDYYHPHILHPTYMISDRISADYFPDVPENEKKPEFNTSGVAKTNIGVVGYSSMQTLENFWRDQRKIIESKNEVLERTVCFYLVQILNGVLFTHSTESTLAFKSIEMKDVLAVTPPSKDKRPAYSSYRSLGSNGDLGERLLVVNPVSQSKVGESEDETLCSDILKFLCFFMKITAEEDLSKLPSKIRLRTKYSRGIQKVIKQLLGNSFASLIAARDVLDFLLWGPSDDEIKSLLLTVEREQAFGIWLEVNRCRIVCDLAKGLIEHNLDSANRLRFLCSASGKSLFDITNCLYK